MRGGAPPDLRLLEADIVTAGIVTGTMIAAPGIGRRIRLWVIGGTYLMSGAAVNRAVCQVGNTSVFTLVMPEHPTFALPLPGGIAAPTNTAIAFYVDCTVAGLTVRLSAYYTIEEV